MAINRDKIDSVIFLRRSWINSSSANAPDARRAYVEAKSKLSKSEHKALMDQIARLVAGGNWH